MASSLRPNDLRSRAGPAARNGRRWYYTDGQNWFYYDNNAWNVYRFDRRFGRDAFERGDYQVPGTGVQIVTPRHKIYVAPSR